MTAGLEGAKKGDLSTVCDVQQIYDAAATNIKTETSKYYEQLVTMSDQAIIKMLKAESSAINGVVVTRLNCEIHLEISTWIGDARVVVSQTGVNLTASNSLLESKLTDEFKKRANENTITELHHCLYSLSAARKQRVLNNLIDAACCDKDPETGKLFRPRLLFSHKGYKYTMVKSIDCPL